MKKQTLILFFSLVFASLILFANPVFAEEKDMTLSSSFHDAAEGTSNLVKDASDGVTGAIGSTSNLVRDGFEDTKSTINDGIRTIEGKNNGYTATRTSAEPTVLGMNSTMWTWFIVILTAIGIGALVWFYNSAKRDLQNQR